MGSPINQPQNWRDTVKMVSWFCMLLVIAVCTSFGCTDNIRAKQFGGTMTRDLPKGKKLVVATWKDADLWLLTRDRKPTEEAESYQFNEESNFGVWEGTVVIKEH